MKRVTAEITTTFTTLYTAEVTGDALQAYGKQQTGKKYLLNATTGKL
jgi:hypothetical protein